VGVEKVRFSRNSENLGDRKCLGKPRKSFLGHPSAILFSRISLEGVFQQPQALTLKCPAQSQMSVMAMLRQLTNKVADDTGSDGLAADKLFSFLKSNLMCPVRFPACFPDVS
jgi:hypothetical protein